MGCLPGGKSVAIGVLDVHNVKGARVALAMSNNAHTPSVVSARDHAQIARVELDMLGHLAIGDVDDNGVVNLEVLLMSHPIVYYLKFAFKFFGLLSYRFGRGLSPWDRLTPPRVQPYSGYGG
jgi:hypothetical protein